jgi:hypothetical protein
MPTRNCNASESDYYLARRYYRLGGPDGAILTRYTISLSEAWANRRRISGLTDSTVIARIQGSEGLLALLSVSRAI